MAKLKSRGAIRSRTFTEGQLEERIYRLRCVEAPVHGDPPLGFPLADLVQMVRPFQLRSSSVSKRPTGTRCVELAPALR